MTQFKQLYTHITSLYYELAPPKYKDPIPANFKPSSGHQNAGSTTQPPKGPPKRKAPSRASSQRQPSVRRKQTAAAPKPAPNEPASRCTG